MDEYFFWSCLHAISVVFLHRSTFFKHFSVGITWMFFFWLLVINEVVFKAPRKIEHDMNFGRNKLTRSWASSVHIVMNKHVHHFHKQFSLLHLRMMWDNHLNNCWRFQFSPETYKTKLELQKRVCHSLMIAFYKRLHTNVRLIHKLV